MLKKLILFVVSANLSAQYILTAPVSTADVTGDAAAHQLASTGTARSVSICALAANTAAVRIGDAAITTVRGFIVAPGSCASYLESTGASDSGGVIRATRYNLAGMYYLAATGDKVSISYTP